MILHPKSLIILFSCLLLFACQSNEKKSYKYLEEFDKVKRDEELYNKCKVNISNVVKHVELYKKYKKKEPESLEAVAREYKIKIKCPADQTPYVYTNIVPKPDEEVNSENIRAFQDGDDKRTFKITCPHHRIKEYGR